MGMPWWTDASEEELERALKMVNRARLRFWLPKVTREALKAEADNYSNILKRMKAMPAREPVAEVVHVPVTREQVEQVISVLPTEPHAYMKEAEIMEKSGLSSEVVQAVLWQEMGNLCSWTTGELTYEDGKPVWGEAQWKGIANPNMRRRTNLANHDGPMTHEEAMGGL
jgi:hypothetical protein